jgi:hypothetical protein
MYGCVALPSVEDACSRRGPSNQGQPQCSCWACMRSNHTAASVDTLLVCLALPKAPATVLTAHTSVQDIDDRGNSTQHGCQCKPGACMNRHALTAWPYGLPGGQHVHGLRHNKAPGAGAQNQGQQAGRIALKRTWKCSSWHTCRPHNRCQGACMLRQQRRDKATGRDEAHLAAV